MIKNKKIVTGIILAVAFAMIFFAVDYLFSPVSGDPEPSGPVVENPPRPEPKPEKEAEKKSPKEIRKEEEQKIYSFLQGPIAYQEHIDWSGRWCKKDIDGNSFGSFGCGLCCMANIYSTLSGREASPWKVFNFARDNTKYSPSGYAGAIDWKYMKSAMKKMGLAVELANKPSSFNKFKKKLKKSESAICLVCSDDDATFWPTTSGHYVNIWLFETKDDSVFIAEPGNNVNNRLTIPAEYIYKALKSASDYQVLYVYSYDESKDKFKPSEGIHIKWNRPKYLKKPANSKF